jgi:hypothetical protein
VICDRHDASLISSRTAKSILLAPIAGLVHYLLGDLMISRKWEKDEVRFVCETCSECHPHVFLLPEDIPHIFRVIPQECFALVGSFP